MSNPLDASILRETLKQYAPEVDADEDGIFATQWLSTETFYRFTEDYVSPEKRLGYKMALERAFPGRKGAL